MIARIWQGAVPEARGDAYFEYLRETGLEEYGSTEGNRGVVVLRRNRAGRAEFLLLSLWKSSEAIRRFAGPEMERAVYYPRDKDFLLELSPGVDHYGVEFDSRRASSRPGRRGGRPRTSRRRTR